MVLGWGEFFPWAVPGLFAQGKGDFGAGQLRDRRPGRAGRGHRDVSLVEVRRPEPLTVGESPASWQFACVLSQLAARPVLLVLAEPQFGPARNDKDATPDYSLHHHLPKRAPRDRQPREGDDQRATTGAARRRRACAGMPPNRSNSRPAWTKRTPITVSTHARPRLKATISTIPSPVRPSAMALNMTMRADGQGNRPPEMPRASRLRQVTGEPSAPGGKWLCSCPSWLWWSA